MIPREGLLTGGIDKLRVRSLLLVYKHWLIVDNGAGGDVDRVSCVRERGGGQGGRYGASW